MRREVLRLYRLEAVPLNEVQQWLSPFERFWRDRLSGLRDLLDRMDEESDRLDGES
ncbi:hypothetical protein [Planobispora takensis]|uniref:Transcriptional regulator n=1 Tax=Planobispora takensis TaxID=1367882 RepID=A0A8J3SRU4_9ACTN|nr:hypothetical protein [Planobispora takensis]GIH99443.1 hypothetical protein Pta02_14520 [Planobispora takensis]